MSPFEMVGAGHPILGPIGQGIIILCMVCGVLFVPLLAYLIWQTKP